MTVSVTGGVQPGVLRRALGTEHYEDGLAARFLMAEPPTPPAMWSDHTIAEEVERDWRILCLRLRPTGFPESQLDMLQNHVYTSILKEGKRTLSITRLDGRAYLRFVAISPLVTAEAMLETLSAARRIAHDYRNL